MSELSRLMGMPSGTHAELAESRQPLYRLTERASQLVARSSWLSERAAWAKRRYIPDNAVWLADEWVKLRSDWERFAVGLDLYMTKEGACPESERLQALAMRELADGG